MSQITLSLEAIEQLATDCLMANGMDDLNAGLLARIMQMAERDGSLSHGLFRLPAFVAGLRSGKINGHARPQAEAASLALIRLDGDLGVAPHAHHVGIPLLTEAARKTGVAVLAIRRSFHMSALWPEVEAIAEAGLVGLACTSYMPSVAPAGATKALFGTDPIAFAWPRRAASPLVYDMATAAMAMGEVQIAAREGHALPAGTGLDKQGQPSTDPKAIVDGGVLLPFGGVKGSAIALMVELLSGPLVGAAFSDETKATDTADGGPPVGGQFLLALNPELISGGADWQGQADSFFERLTGLPGPGVRLPGARRHKNRLDSGPRQLNEALIEKINALL